MRLRVIFLVLAVGSLMLVSFMLPLALLLRAFAADNAISGATIRAQFMAPLVATLDATDLRLAVNRTSEGHTPWPSRITISAIELLPARVDVQADHRAVHDEATRPERGAGWKAGGQAIGDLLLGGREIGLTNVETGGHGAARPGL